MLHDNVGNGDYDLLLEVLVADARGAGKLPAKGLLGRLGGTSCDVWGASWDVWGALRERYVLGGDVWQGRCDDNDDRNDHHVSHLGAKWLKTIVLYGRDC